MSKHPQPIAVTPGVGHFFEREIISIIAGEWQVIFVDDADPDSPSLAIRRVFSLAAVQEFVVYYDAESGKKIGREWYQDCVVPVDLNGENPGDLGLVDAINFLGVLPADADPYAKKYGICPAGISRPKSESYP